MAKTTDVAAWFYVPAWTSAVSPRLEERDSAPAGRWLVLGDQEGPGRDVADRLQLAGAEVVLARPGERLQKERDDAFTLRPGAPEDYRALLDQLEASGRTPSGVLHAWTAAPADGGLPSAERLAREHEHGFLSALFLVQALGRRHTAQGVRLMLLSRDLHEVTGGEATCPERRGLLALAKVAAQERPSLTTCALDLSSSETGAVAKATLDLVVAECLAPQAGAVIALRGGRRWLQTFQQVRLPPPSPGRLRIRERGTYVITGGLGEIGLALAEYLSRTHQARLVLVSRSALPPRAEWDAWVHGHGEEDPTRRRILGVRTVEAAGGEVLVAAADVADLDRMREVWVEAEARFGQVHGVIHAAGTTRGRTFAPLLDLDREACLEQLQGKAVGAIVIEELLRGRRPDFVVLMSSLSAVLGGFGMGAYAAANLFLDGLAQQKRRDGDDAWTSIDWDAWQPASPATRSAAGRGLAALALSSAEGVTALERVLGAAVAPQVVVSTADLQARIDRSSIRDVPADQPVPATGRAASHPRPALATPYAAPRDALEAALADAWAALLGVEAVGIHDDFFELGGHSLLATQIVSRVRDRYDVEVSLRAFFEAPTVSGLAATASRQIQARETPREAAIARAPSSERGELSFAQQRLWFFDQLQPQSAAYNLFLPLRHRGALDPDALGRALREVVRRHEVLRTRFHAVGGRPVAEVDAEPSVALPLVDLSDLAGADGEAAARRLAREENARPFDLARGPLLRAKLLRLRADDHLLLLTMHHIVSDGWSMGVLVRELGRLYEAFRAGCPSPLPELAIQYADFAAWQRRWLEGGALAEQLAYWRRRLQGSPPVLELPTDRPRPAVQSFRGAVTRRALGRALSEEVRALGSGEGASLFMTLLAAFQVLLARLCGEDDVVVGTPIAGRNRAETEGLIGFFINTLVLRTDLSGQPSFREALRRVRDVSLGAYAHQDLPFEKLVEELQPARDLGRTPLFQVVFNLLNLEVSAAAAAGMAFEPLLEAGGDDHAPPEVPAKFDLTLYAGDRPTGIQLTAAYNADLFDRARIDEILAQLEELLRQAVERPDEAVSRLSLVTPAARPRLPDPSLALSRAGTETIPQRLERWALDDAARVAVREGRRSWTYGELESAARRLGGALRAQGIGAGHVVAIWGRRSASLVWALLGVVESGAAFAVLDPAYPASRLLACARQAGVRAWIGLAGTAEPTGELAGFRDRIGCRLELPDGIGGAPWSDDPERGVDPGPAVVPDAHAYVAFTSGSTGTPKAIVGTHRPLSHFLEWQAATFGLRGDDRFALLSGLSHDPLLRDVFAPLWVGATLCVPAGDEIAEGRLLEWMAGEEVTAVHLTPAMARLLAPAGHSVAGRPGRGTTGLRSPLPHLRYAFFGGDVLQRGDVRRLRALAPQVRCVNFYGATETPQAMGWFEVPADDADNAGEDREAIPVGRGIEGVQLLVRNPAGGLAGVGEKGEIHVRTAYLAQGYLGDEALTRARFLPSGPGEERAYRTGDIGRYRPDGAVEYAGRDDGQVKLRGFRIELGEIEAVLREHASVRQCAVVTSDAGGERRLVAYVVAEGGTEAAAWSEHLAQRLPAHMIPSAFVRLDQLPMTPNGKLDRAALPGAEATRESTAGRVAPRTSVEEVVSRLWSELLEGRDPGVHDRFFEVGGHSLLATQLVSRLRDVLGVDLPLATVFQRPTIAGMAEALVADAATRRDVERTADAVLELAELSDAEVEARLDAAGAEGEA
ncbi:MAG TPA: amino acid adenylation domain-containing protein [Vicinamibacteria bacterium]|nr:amino acid adenylation domain-containing protein [Vicinamibacteria bacterium]